MKDLHGYFFGNIIVLAYDMSGVLTHGVQVCGSVTAYTQPGPSSLWPGPYVIRRKCALSFRD